GRAGHTSEMGDAVGVADHGDQNAEHHTVGEVGGDDGGDHGHHHHGDLRLGHPAQCAGADRVPVEGRPGDVDHHRDQGGHRDQPHDVTEPDHQEQQEHTGQEGGDPGAGPGGLHVDHGLTDHRAAAHAAEEAGDDVGHALGPGLTGLVRSDVGDVVDQLRGH